jgi:alanyl-tRNA synthetase
LRTVLGDTVRQNGSDITPERLRFDFTYHAKLTEEQRQAVEKLANDVVARNLPVHYEDLSIDEALATGALSFFREKYADRVRVYSIGEFSRELCGGPHVASTRQVGLIRILSEKSSSAGIRRIKAVVDSPAAGRG